MDTHRESQNLNPLHYDLSSNRVKQELHVIHVFVRIQIYKMIIEREKFIILNNKSWNNIFIIIYE